MNGKMYPVPFPRLLEWIKGEYRHQRSIFGINSVNFYKTPGSHEFKLGDQSCWRPLGPAAGPHTQMAQNIVAAYLTGARYFELKTVQQLDNLEIAKPCIAADKEGYNTEWSTELSVPEAFDEYLKAWLAIAYIRHSIIKEWSGETHRYIFNMSIGYDLAGIQSSKIDHFIENMRLAEKTPQFKKYCKHLIEVEKFTWSTSSDISSSITLSTMHGCPPGEIEAIATYLLADKRLHTYVKLNPTLLGYDFVRSTLDRTGFRHIQLNPASFERDLQFVQAIPILKRLQSLAIKNNLTFGVKLSNTLAVINNQGKLPGEEMYLSGSALYPLTINLAFRLAQVFDSNLPISYSGGADFFNIGKILSTGIAPITVATNLLKPGGYLRLGQLAEEVDKHSGAWESGKVNLEILAQLAEQAIPPNRQNIYIEPKPVPKAARRLPLFDCFIAPCQERCPIHQDVANYLRFVNKSDFDNALESILMQNPLPNITGYICDHQCMSACTRNYYDNPLAIRDMKRVAAENGHIQSQKVTKKKSTAKRVAILGAGPAGLATAFFLQKAGFSVTVFDRNPQAGGTVRFIIPGFRLPLSAIERDVRFIASQGVGFIFGQPSNLTIEELRQNGFDYIVLAIGAGISPSLPIQSENSNIIEAVEFLKRYNQKANFNLGRTVAIIGGGNSAMDAARAARRIPGVAEVSILYRRTIAQMPADQEEVENALADGVVFRELITPVEFSKDGILKCQRMRLGEPDASGRPRPVPVNDFEDLCVDTLITAIGEQVDQKYLRKIGLNPNKRGRLDVNPETNESTLPNVFIGGDAFRGPATVVEAITDARKIATAILKKEKLPVATLPSSRFNLDSTTEQSIVQKKGKVCSTTGVFNAPEQIKAEAGRCLECDLLCMRCVDVCPNRANIAVRVEDDNFRNAYQIVHLDALCNECGNCATFCLYENGQPYRNKFTIFSDVTSFTDSQNDGYVRTGNIFLIRTASQTWQFDPEKDTDPKDYSLENRQVINLLQILRTEYPYL
ncbi:MAG: putative selenate reductase subunit YgfK [Candidatus Neomarinimicrobiota bacterium]